MNPARSLGCVLAIFAVSSGCLAQDLLYKSGVASTVRTSVATGHSAAYYGIRGAVPQRASLRAVLAAGGLDELEQKPGLGAAVALTLVEMFAGGGGSPSDLARPRNDVKAALIGD